MCAMIYIYQFLGSSCLNGNNMRWLNVMQNKLAIFIKIWVQLKFCSIFGFSTPNVDKKFARDISYSNNLSVPLCFIDKFPDRIVISYSIPSMNFSSDFIIISNNMKKLSVFTIFKAKLINLCLLRRLMAWRLNFYFFRTLRDYNWFWCFNWWWTNQR